MPLDIYDHYMYMFHWWVGEILKLIWECLNMFMGANTCNCQAIIANKTHKNMLVLLVCISILINTTAILESYQNNFLVSPTLTIIHSERLVNTPARINSCSPGCCLFTIRPLMLNILTRIPQYKNLDLLVVVCHTLHDKGLQGQKDDKNTRTRAT